MIMTKFAARHGSVKECRERQTRNMFCTRHFILREMAYPFIPPFACAKAIYRMSRGLIPVHKTTISPWHPIFEPRLGRPVSVIQAISTPNRQLWQNHERMKALWARADALRKLSK